MSWIRHIPRILLIFLVYVVIALLVRHIEKNKNIIKVISINKMSSFKKQNSFDKRKTLFRRIHASNPERIPIICERSKHSTDVPVLAKVKYLAPKGTSIGAFIQSIRGQMEIKPHQALFIFVGDSKTLPSPSATLESVYDAHKSDDGFLYIEYSGENTFGI